ncbi:App1 family protein [Maribellus maritimus]|uniref:App1 family protein n=1 Tax=Maribellus maritimus TaxID=2870838 RepID=UPI001EEBCE2F|nr:phosphatase domain-containing protein [Maribellus maritimus]MCG6187111.1 DUF2183 domain-containing protein [Maribellus maritimus]
MKYFKPVFRGIKKPFKFLKVFLKQKAGWLDVPKILPYKGYGNETDVFIEGMVIEDKGLTKPKDNQQLWQNILATFKRFSSDEIPGVKVKAEFLHEKQIATTDEKGFFSFHFYLPDKKNELLTKEWHTVHLSLLDQIVENQPQIYTTGEVRITSGNQSRIIVSDIDDTVMISHSTQTLRKLRLMLLKNALTRLPFPGVAQFYQSLNHGKEKQENNPFFYVSSSEWNLYDLLEDFFSFNKLPKGVFLLRKLNNSIYKFWKSGGGNHDHKYKKIKALLKFYPQQKFILIGDSGQQDPSIYSKIAFEFPGRIEAIYIRRIRSKSFAEKQENLDEKLLEVQTLYTEVKDTIQAARHASKNGLINAGVPSEIKN